MKGTTKERMVVALPTDKPIGTNINKPILVKEGDYFRILKSYYKNDITDHYFFTDGTCARRDMYTGKLCYLYFLSDEDIKEGDWYIRTHPVDGKYRLCQDNNDAHGICDCKKVVATTNPSLWYNGMTGIDYRTAKGTWTPIISKIDTTFIEAFVREQGKIDKVLLEYEKDNVWNTSDFAPSHLKLKPNESVIVHPYKEKTYTRDDMYKLAFHLKTTYFGGLSVQNLQEWFNKHYPQ